MRIVAATLHFPDLIGHCHQEHAIVYFVHSVVVPYSIVNLLNGGTFKALKKPFLVCQDNTVKF
jgi:hypothetical protein